MASSSALRDVFTEFWTWRMRNTPEFAYLIGWKGVEHRGKLESYKLDAFVERKDVCVDFLKKIEKLRTDLSDPEDLLNCEIFCRELQDYIDGHPFKGYMFPVSFMEGIQLELPKIVNDWMTYKNAEDYERLVETYEEAVPRQVDEIIALLRRGVEEGMTQHAESMNGAVVQFDSLLAKKPSEQPLLRPLADFPPGVADEDRVRLRTRITGAVEGVVLPALRRLRDYLDGEYAKHLRPGIGSSTLPTGPAFYEQCLRFHTATDLTPKEIHQMGLDEVAKTEGRMREIIKEVGSGDDVGTFMEKMRNDKRFVCASKEELVDRLRKLGDVIETKLLKIVHKVPEMKLVLQEAPPEEAEGPAAQYIAGTPDGSRPGVFFINANNFSSQPTYELVPLALHEGNPGHHLQACYLIERDNVPEFRQYLEDRKYSDPPSRFPFHTAYVEGWGLYSETLGHDLGMYEDPYDRFGQLSFDIYRACRLVVDTGLHAFGWTKEKAVQFMLDHTANSREDIENEVRRYITWPGQACAYKVGQLKLLELRKRAETELGPDFDIRDFHEVILRHFGPLYLVERGVDSYIKAKKTSL